MCGAVRIGGDCRFDFAVIQIYREHARLAAATQERGPHRSVRTFDRGLRAEIGKQFFEKFRLIERNGIGRKREILEITLFDA